MKIKGSWVLILIIFSITNYLLWGYEDYRIVINALYIIYSIMIYIILLIEVYENNRVEINNLKLIRVRYTAIAIVMYYLSIFVWIFLILRIIFIFFDKHLTFTVGNMNEE